MPDDVLVTSLAIDWTGVPRRDTHPFDVPAIAGLHELDLSQRITFFCGERHGQVDAARVVSRPWKGTSSTASWKTPIACSRSSWRARD